MHQTSWLLQVFKQMDRIYNQKDVGGVGFVSQAVRLSDIGETRGIT
jgi:hypothetical protein